MTEKKGSAGLGSIVSFEGFPETISTQLHLLPTSPQILILPGIQCYLPAEDSDRQQEPHVFIRQVHEASIARNDAAHSFLQSATASHKRLVFMNGGTATAQALCIRHIMQHQTNGDHVKAERIFNFLVKEGLAGLECQPRNWKRLIHTPKSAVEEDDEDDGAREASLGTAVKVMISPKSRRQRKKEQQEQRQRQRNEGGLDEDPITRAMRAAEALDRQTASLQPSNEIDLTSTSRQRSSSLPMYGYTDNFGDAAPFLVFGGRLRIDGTLYSEEAPAKARAPSTAPRFSVTHYGKEDLDYSTLLSYGGSESSPSCVGETYGPTFLHSPLFDVLPTPRTETFGVRTPGETIFGEASLDDVSSGANRSFVARVRSLDRIYPSSPMFRDLCLPSQAADHEGDSSERPHSCMLIPDELDPSSRRLNPIEGPRTIVVRARQPSIINLGPVPSSRKKRKISRSSYVDRGTDSGIDSNQLEESSPVLAATEDLVVYFKEEVSDALLDKAIRSFRDGSSQITSSATDFSESDTVNDNLPSTPKSQVIHDGEETPKIMGTEVPSVVSPSIDVDDYDPFAYVNDTPPQQKATKTASTAKVERPPTPEPTPAPSVSDIKDDKFYEFRLAPDQTAVATQNSLRSVLNTYFPPEAQGYHQFSFSLLPELEALWKPIFREAEPDSPRANNRRVDQILAVGSQRGVKKDFSSTVIGHLDRLGAKRSGMSRSGRLDFRYLLANAMQAFTAQPLASQTCDNPFNNSYLLATLIIPHLEMYLALHSEVRYLLLEYPPEHLSTILALQKLVGIDLMKVSQIVGPGEGDLGPFTHMRGASISRQDKKSYTFGRPVWSSGDGHSDNVVSKANFLLTSDATDAEIATFIATIRELLVEVSQYYAPEELPETHQASPVPPKQNAGAKKVPTSSFSPLARDATANVSSALAAPQRSTSPTPSAGASSAAETAQTYKTVRTGRSTKKSRTRRRPPTSDGAESFMTFDPAEDSDYDIEERRLMPIFMQKQSQKPKPNSRKALKFLGLA